MKSKRMAVKKTLLAQALSVAFLTGVVSVAYVDPAYAQSNTTGIIFGTVEAPAGSTVTITNAAGYHRTITPDAAGRFSVASVPVGEYSVALSKGGKVERTFDGVSVKISQGAEVNFVSSAQRIEVTGRQIHIDVSSSSGGTNFSAKELAVLPIQPSVASIVQLAPSTTRADFRYGNNAASFGGSGSSENSVYINGFTVTNGLYQVGYPSLPFGAIAQAQVITGGFGAEFGRSTGGVINITTKSGTNDFDVSAGFTLAPNAWRSKQKNIMYPTTGAAENATTDGKLLYYNEGNKRSEQTYNLAVSGPIVKDKLFFYYGTETKYFQQEASRLASSSVSAASTGWLEQSSIVPRSLIKLDWNITNDQHLEYTQIRDKSMVTDRYFGFNYATLQRNYTQGGGAAFVNYASGVPFLGATGAALAAAQGANIDIFKYTGYLTDDLTVQALYGKSKTVRVQTPFGYIPGQYVVGAAVASRAPGINYVPSQPQGFTSALLRDGAFDTNDGFRLDLEYKLASKHTVRAGLDNNHIKALNGTETAGGGQWTYQKSATPNALSTNMTATPASTGSPLGALGYYVQEVHGKTGSTPSVKQSAQYIEDRFQATKDFLLTVGIRNEQFSNMNQDGVVFVEQKSQIAPRVSAIWDVNGDASMKAFATGGRYHLQLPANLAVRFAGASLNTSHYWTYTGVDPVTGKPLGLVSIGNIFSSNSEFGQGINPKTIAAVDLKAQYQDEFTLGFERALTPKWNFGARVNYRKLQSAIDDLSDGRGVAKAGLKSGVLTAAEAASLAEYGNWHGALMNPGQDNTFNIEVAPGVLKQVHTTWADLGFPEGLKRDYIALDFMFEHPMRDGWYGKFDYTWSRSKGNTEGQQKSDNGQADVGFTSTWDFPENMINSSGMLPNDRTHMIKAYGLYEITPEWGVSGNLLMASGRPRSCSANLTVAQDPLGIGADYGSIFYTCPGALGRGALGRLPWDNRIDLGVMYKPQLVKGLLVKFEVFNVFNRQTVTSINEERNVTGGNLISATSQMEQNFTSPRAASFSVQYYKKF